MTEATSTTTTRRSRMFIDSAEPAKVDPYMDPMQVIFRRAVAAILGSKNIACSNDSYEYISLLAEEYMIDIFSKLHRLTNMQRRTCPAVVDLASLMANEHIQIVDLEKQLGLQSKFTVALANSKFDDTEAPISDEARAFFTQSSSAKSLIPTKKRRGKHIPSWLPAYPPDHTFMATPQYADRITDPRQLREKVVEEGRLAEEALRRLTGVVSVDVNNGEDDEDEDDDHKQQDNKQVAKIEFDETRATSLEPDGDTSTNDIMKLPDEPPPKKKFITESHDDESSGPISLAALTTPMEAETAIKTEDQPSESPQPARKPIKLKLSLGRAKPAVQSNGNGGATTSATTSNNIGDTPDFQPENSSEQKSKFDVLAYIKKRKEIVANREKRQLERKQQHTAQPSHPSQSIIDHEYTAALASIQRSKDRHGDTNRVLDTGVVNWDRDRYLS